MNVEASVLAILKASLPLTLLCGQRMYALILPEPFTSPALTYQRISEVADSTLDGPGTFTEIRLQIDCWSTTSHAEASAVADAVSTALNGYTGTALGVRFYNVMRDNSQDFYEPNSHCYRRSVDFKIQFAA